MMLCVMENADVLWESMDKEKLMNCLMGVIQRGNMKRPLSLSVEVLKRLASKMNETESDRSYKIRLLDGVLESLCRNAADSQSRIRRSPGSRLVIHAVCTSDPDPSKVSDECRRVRIDSCRFRIFKVYLYIVSRFCQ